MNKEPDFKLTKHVSIFLELYGTTGVRESELKLFLTVLLNLFYTFSHVTC